MVADEALKRACYVVRFLFADRKDIRDNMYKYFGRVAVIGKNQSKKLHLLKLANM